MCNAWFFWCFIANTTNFHLLYSVPMGVRKINWEFSVILIFNYCFKSYLHSSLPRATLWFLLKTSYPVQSHPVYFFLRAEDLSRVREDKKRQCGAGYLYLLKVNGKIQIPFSPFPLFMQVFFSPIINTILWPQAYSAQ